MAVAMHATDVPGLNSMACVLLVDDDTYPLVALAAVFEVHGLDVLMFNDGFDALLKAMEVSPDLILTDWEMRQVDGMTFCQRLRRIPRFAAVPLLLTSGKKPPDDAVVGRFSSKAHRYSYARIVDSGHASGRLKMPSCLDIAHPE